uniref:H/ACA ribonucleoprotein complex non-core subunit NAF1 n=1 Tax=Globodera pallida TaxID=36090 RepID=A0A183CIJ9_GLOPA
MKRFIPNNATVSGERLHEQKGNGQMQNGNVLLREASVDSCDAASECQTTNSVGTGDEMDEEKFGQHRVVVGQIDDMDSNFITLTGTNGDVFRIPRGAIYEPILGSYYQIEGTFFSENDTLVPIFVVALTKDSKALLDARAKFWDEKFGGAECSIQAIAELGIESLVKKIFDYAEPKEAAESPIEEDEIQQKSPPNLQNEVQHRVVVGQIDDMHSNFITLTGTNGDVFRIPRGAIYEPILGSYYQIEGTFFSENDTLVPISVVALTKDSKALLDARAKFWDEKFGGAECSIQAIAELGIESLVKKIFDYAEPKEAAESPMEEHEIQQKAPPNLQNEVTNSEQTSKSQTTESSEYESFPCSSSSSSKELLPKVGTVVNAIALRADGRGNICMFSPDLFNVPFFRISNQSLNAPLIIGKWYSLNNPFAESTDVDIQNGTVFVGQEMSEAKFVSDLSPMRTRLERSTVQLYVNVKRADPTGTDSVYCSDNFPKIFDGGGFLNGFIAVKEEPMFRHAPERKFGVWCSLRKHPIKGIHWKIVRVDPESKPKKTIAEHRKSKSPSPSASAPTLSPPSAPKHSPSPSASAPTLSPPSAPKRSPSPSVATPLSPIRIPKEEAVLVEEGLVCSQNEKHFLVYSLGNQWLVRLDKRKSEGKAILGMWIQFQVREEGGSKFAENFNFIPQRVHATPTPDFVLVRSRLQVPRVLQLSETPWCEELRTNVIDEHGQLKREHYGKTVSATIGCPSQMPGNSHGVARWLLLNVEDD